MANYLDKSIQYLFNMSHRDILWKNASPSSSFSPQELSVPCSSYDIISIEFQVTSGRYHITSTAFYFSGLQLPGGYTTSIDSASADVVFIFRNTVITASQISVLPGARKYTAGQQYVDNSVMIPYIIYGIKLA